MTMVEKMRGPSDEYCPQWRKPMNKVCHTCRWWQSYPVSAPDNTASIRWECAIVLQAVLQKDQLLSARGLQHATESWRNEVVAVGQQQIEAADTVRRLSEKRQLRDLVQASHMKLIEGDAS